MLSPDRLVSAFLQANTLYFGGNLTVDLLSSATRKSFSLNTEWIESSSSGALSSLGADSLSGYLQPVRVAQPAALL